MTEKCYQNFENEIIKAALSSIQEIIQCKKIHARCGAGICIACLWNAKNSSWQAIGGTSGVRKRRKITWENFGNTYQVFPIHFICQLMLVKNLATNTGIWSQQGQISWWKALRKALQAVAGIVQKQLHFHSVIPWKPLRKSFNYNISQICQILSQNAREIAADQ